MNFLSSKFPLGSIWLGGWKNEEIEEILISLICFQLEGRM